MNRGFCLLVALCTVLSGCAVGGSAAREPVADATVTQTAQGTSRAQPTPVASSTVDGIHLTYLGQSHGSYDFPSRGVSLTPATGSAAVTWEEAAKACFEGALPCVLHERASVTLVDATFLGAKGLVYTVAWNPTDCMSIWPTTEYKAGDLCRQVDLITASTVGRLAPGQHPYTFVVRADDADGL